MAAFYPHRPAAKIALCLGAMIRAEKVYFSTFIINISPQNPVSPHKEKHPVSVRLTGCFDGLIPPPG